MERLGDKVSFDPQVELIGTIDDPYYTSVGAARTCYAKDAVSPEKAKERPDIAEKVYDSVYEAGHHTTIQHPNLTFIIRGISRQCLWSFLHSHPFYNSEQVSQRYVEVKPKSFVVPPMSSHGQDFFIETVKEQIAAYNSIRGYAHSAIEDAYYQIFPTRKKDPARWKKGIEKKVMEVARYVLPIAVKAHLYHSIAGVTLHRYMKMSQQFETPEESRILIERMAALVKEKDPMFFRKVQDPIPLEETPEFAFMSEFYGGGRNPNAGAHKREFDTEMGDLSSRLVGFMPNDEELLAKDVRNIFGAIRELMPDDDAIDRVLNPARNPNLGNALNTNSMSRLSRTMQGITYKFQKKISHTADSQNQRHRMVPGTRPLLEAHFNPDEPDVIWPSAFSIPTVYKIANTITKKTWQAIDWLLSNGVSWEHAQYLLPNATAIRFTESGSLLNLHHKWTTRLCYLAQDEIWQSCRDEVVQVKEVHPRIGKHLHAPCGLRKTAGKSPYCPEGNRYCGVPVWNLPVEKFERTI